MTLTVYLDSLLILNLILDYLLLLLAGHIAGATLYRWRIALAAALGSLYALAAFWPAWPFLRQAPTQIAVGVMMVLIAYANERRLLRLTVLFFALSAALGGALYALQLMWPGLGRLNVKYILLCSAVIYCALSLAGRKLARHSPRELKAVEVELDGHVLRLTALVDSGNTLTDPMTGAPVIVAEGERLAGLLPAEADFRHPCLCFPTLREPKRFRLLPYRAVGVDKGLLLAVRADRVTVAGRDMGQRLVALSPTPVSDGGGYHALISEEP